jgi:hypothetical protein
LQHYASDSLDSPMGGRFEVSKFRFASWSIPFTIQTSSYRRSASLFLPFRTYQCSNGSLSVFGFATVWIIWAFHSRREQVYQIYNISWMTRTCLNSKTIGLA